MGFHHRNHLRVYNLINHHLHQLARVCAQGSVNEIRDNFIWKKNLHSFLLMPRAGSPGLAGGSAPERPDRMEAVYERAAARLQPEEPGLDDVISAHSPGACTPPECISGGKNPQTSENRTMKHWWGMWAMRWCVELLSILLKSICSYLNPLKIFISISWASPMTRIERVPAFPWLCPIDGHWLRFCVHCYYGTDFRVISKTQLD